MKKASIKDYLALARFDHWIKQAFILPGVAAGIAFTDFSFGKDINGIIFRLITGIFATSAVASANYVINEFLDKKFDKFHPTKKFRAAVQIDLKARFVYIEYALLALIGLGLSLVVSLPFFITECWLLLMGVLYNVRPFRTKDIPYIDVLSESINNAIRLLLGWFMVTSNYLPPITIVLGYWMGGAFLMAIKRFSEYRMIDDKSTAALYRKSFARYSEKSLLISGFFYALTSMFFCGVFMIKYRIELLLAVPIFCGLFCYYLNIAFKQDSSAQKPEKLFKEKGLMLYVAIAIIVPIVLMFVDIPLLNALSDPTFIGFGG